MKIDKELVKRDIDGDRNALFDAFLWRDTEQGEDYWVDQYCSDTPIDVDALRKMLADGKMETGTLKELNVNPGDVVECVDGRLHATKGQLYTINEFGDISQYTKGNTNSSTFRIISRVQDTPKTWGEMTDAEKGALLLAQHEGKIIQILVDGYWCIVTPCWDDDIYYRVKPEPKRETVTVYGGDTSSWCFDRAGAVTGDTHRITFDLIDGEPDCDSIRMKRI